MSVRPSRLGRAAENRMQELVGGSARLRVVVLLASALALSAADTSTVGAVAGELERALHIGNIEVGLLVTVSTGIGALATLPVGALTDRVNRSHLLAGSILVWSVALIVCGASTSFLMLLLARVGLGAVTATAGPTVTSLTGDLFPSAERGRIFGYVLSGQLLGIGFGFLVSGTVAGVLSWRYSFWVLAVPGLVLAWSIWRLLPEPARGGRSRLRVGDKRIRPADEVKGEADAEPDHAPANHPEAGPAPERQDDKTQDGTDDDPDAVADEVRRAGVRPHAGLILRSDPARMSLWRAVRYVLSIHTNVYLIVASALGYFFFSGVQTFGVLFVRDRFGLSQTTASSLVVLLGIGSIAGVLVTGRISDRLIGRHRLGARPLVAAVAFLVAAGLFLPSLLTTSLLVAAPLLFLAAAAVGGANPPLDAARLDLMHSGLWGRAESVRTVLRSALEAAAPLLFGYISTLFGGAGGGLGHPTAAQPSGAVGLDKAFLVMLVLLVGAGLILLLFARRSYPADVATAIASQQATGPAAA